MANIRKPASVVRLLTNSSFAIALILGLGLSLVVTREAKTATVTKEDGHVSVVQATVSASLAPIVEQPKIELLHDAPVSAPVMKSAPATVQSLVQVATIPTIALPKIIKPAHHTVKMMVTAYCACPKCCGPDAIGLTASGKDVSYNSGKFVAADKQFAFGTNLIIPGYNDSKPVEVQDRGGAIKGNHLDVFFPTHQEALEWGRRVIDVTVID
jgi:3D (Asp-Asp-Asp) domain-containing protein